MIDDDAQDGAREILVVNDTFYRAFAARDFDRMEALWASGAPVSCIHPGWNAVRGRDAVIASWRSILTSPDAPDVACAEAVAFPSGDFAYVICEERLAGAVLIATNIFVRERGAWKLTHHHAGQVVVGPLAEIAPGTDRTIN